MEEKLIAPCGMNCGVCVGYLAMNLEWAGIYKEVLRRLPATGKALQVPHEYGGKSPFNQRTWH